MIPETSPDPAIRHLVARQNHLATERQQLADRLVAVQDNARHLRQIMRTLAACRQTPEARPQVSALEHYPMLDSPDCGCPTCQDWEIRRAEFVEALTLVPREHKWTTCACSNCRFVGRIHLNYLAASNRRDLLIEFSFHAKYHCRNGEAVMGWLDAELQRPQYSTNWLAQELSRFPMERWLRKCATALAPQFSGEVWLEAAGVTELTVTVGSSLGAAVELYAGVWSA